MQKSLYSISISAMLLLAFISLTSCKELTNNPEPKPAVDLFESGFENGFGEWDATKHNDGMSVISADAARSGKSGLRITDQSKKDGSSLYSPAFPAKPNKEYRAQCYARCVKGTGGIALYMQFLDAQEEVINTGSPNLVPLAGKNKWTKAEVSAFAPEKTAYVRIWFHSYSHAIVTEDVDDVKIYQAPVRPSMRPWKPQYKLRPDQRDKLTPADIPGPDGIVYPDFRYAGVQGGIPKVQVITDLTGKVQPKTDISHALQKAVMELPTDGGAILIPPGEYYLKSRIQVTRSRVVIRGSGRDKTKLIFNYAIPAKSVQFHGIKPKTPFGYFEVHANPKGLRGISLLLGDKVIRSKHYHAHWGNTFSLRVWNGNILKHASEGLHKLNAVAEFEDGTKATAEIEALVTSPNPPAKTPGMPGVIEFTGGKSSQRVKLTKDGVRGGTSVTVADASAFKTGDVFEIQAPASKRWNEMVKNACAWGSYRLNQYRIIRIDGSTLHFAQPLRIDFPVVDGSYVAKIEPVEWCGIEDCTIEQTENLWINSASLTFAWNCWVKNVKTIMSGRNITYFLNSKHGEVRDCIFDDAWFKGGGGTAYAGFERSFDCLMENVESFNLRHGPNLNWACAGNVFRNSTFHGSDGQWHCGWCHENLFENCAITPDAKDGDYGYGLFATSPEDVAHGPIGPRNVVYNCDISSPKTGLQLGGMNENWIIAYNRFRINKGRAIFLRMGSFDHIIHDNVFCIKTPRNPVIFLNDPNCIGCEFTDNRFYGAHAPPIAGRGKIAVDKNNQVFPYQDAPRPQPKIRSIFEWQKKTYPLPQ